MMTGVRGSIVTIGTLGCAVRALRIGAVRERVFERANQRHGLWAHWCPAEFTEVNTPHERAVHQ
jgi:hypothetical protein